MQLRWQQNYRQSSRQLSDYLRFSKQAKGIYHSPRFEGPDHLCALTSILQRWHDRLHHLTTISQRTSLSLILIILKDCQIITLDR
jgi:hypothetical protein